MAVGLRNNAACADRRFDARTILINLIIGMIVVEKNEQVPIDPVALRRLSMAHVRNVLLRFPPHQWRFTFVKSSYTRTEYLSLVY